MWTLWLMKEENGDEWQSQCTLWAGGWKKVQTHPSLMDSFNTKKFFTCNCARAALYTERSEPGRSGRVGLRYLVSLDCFLLFWNHVPVEPIPGNMDISQTPRSEGKQTVIPLLTPYRACMYMARNILQYLGKSARQSAFLLWGMRAFLLLTQESKIVIEILSFSSKKMILSQRSFPE